MSAPIPYQPGDVHVFNRGGFFNWIIKVKTGSRFTHVEAVAWNRDGQPMMVGSRNGQGVAIYDPDAHGLALVARPVVPFDLAAAMKWCVERALGQGYDWLGLLSFFTAKTAGENGKMFCSEFLTRFYRAGGLDPFPGADADTVAPKEFSRCPLFAIVWRSPEEEAREQARLDLAARTGDPTLTEAE